MSWVVTRLEGERLDWELGWGELSCGLGLDTD